jgi:hypothetical protein
VLRTLPLCTCCRHYPGTATGCIVCSLPQSYQLSPIRDPGQPVHRHFRGLLGVHSRYGLHTRTVTVFRDSFTEGFNRFVTSTVAPVASGWSICRVGFSPTGKAPPYHGAPRYLPVMTVKSGSASCANAPTALRQVNGEGFGELNLDVHYALPQGWTASLGIYNLLNTHAAAAEFWYVDRLQNEIVNYPDGRADIHQHPLEPIMARFTIAKRFWP